MIKKLILLTLLLTLFPERYLFPQAKLENRNNFYEAESWILFEDFEEALPIYQSLHKIFPTNSNYKYRLGQCYLNKPGEKDKAIGYLEDAVKNIDPNYKEGKFKETGAPYDALYYLANAYRINNQLDKAIETYQLFKQNLNSRIYNPDIVDEQIQSCLNAKELMKNPLYVKEINLGSNINENNSEFNPVISDDEKIMVFSKSEAFYDAILYSTKVNGEWSGPINLNEALKVDQDLYPTSISSDGKTLYLYSSLGYDGIIYSSTYQNGSWGPLVKLNDNINTKYWESHAAISHDNRKLYFTSNRKIKGAFGGLDIYVSKRDTTGDWGTPVNLGPVINTPYHEDTPFLSKDDKTLFFSSRGHFNMGGYDIFYSTLLDNGQWSVPMNLGYPLNTTDDDVFFKPINEGYEGYLSRYIPGNYGQQDIYRMEIFSDEHPRKFIVRGVVTIADLLRNMNDKIKISALNTKKPDQVVVVYSNPQTGEYELQLPQGNFEVSYEGPGGEKMQRNLELALTNPSDSVLLPGTILPKTDFVADLSVESQSVISVAKGDTIIIPVKAEPGSMLVVEHWLGDSLLYTEQFPITDSTFYYKMVPRIGDNKITFKLTDRFSNTTTADVLITRKPEQTIQQVIRPEYNRIISEKQIAALTEMEKNRAGNDLKKIISESSMQKNQFGKVDDQIAFIKEQAINKGINPEEVDRLALEIALKDNVLTQAAVDYLAKNTDGELKKILSEIDIYDLNLKTWNDLQKYIAEKTGGKITAEALDKIAQAVLTRPDVTIATEKEKFLALSENPEYGKILTQAITSTESKGIKDGGQWLQSVYNESIKLGLSDKDFARILASLSSLPGTSVEQFRSDLAANADEPFRSWLNSLDLKKEGIKTPEDLILFILKNKDKIGPEDLIFKAFANIIHSRNIPVETIKSGIAVKKEGKWWILWLLLGAGVIFWFIFWYRRKNKKTRKEQNLN
jgi:WD40-like Beta Propeller Repeat/Tetratricopeptide repeat